MVATSLGLKTYRFVPNAAQKYEREAVVHINIRNKLCGGSGRNISYDLGTEKHLTRFAKHHRDPFCHAKVDFTQHLPRLPEQLMRWNKYCA